jgi:hypothetical protein
MSRSQKSGVRKPRPGSRGIEMRVLLPTGVRLVICSGFILASQSRVLTSGFRLLTPDFWLLSSHLLRVTR